MNGLPGIHRVAAVLIEDESYLWPQAVDHAALAGAELAATWPRRCDVPAPMWTTVLRAAGRNVDVLAFAGLFLTEEHSGRGADRARLILVRANADVAREVVVPCGGPQRLNLDPQGA